MRILQQVHLPDHASGCGTGRKGIMGALRMRDVFTTKKALTTQFFVAAVVVMVTLAIQFNVLRWPSFWVSAVAIALNALIVMWATAKCRSFYEDKITRNKVLKTIQITAVQLLATALMGILVMYCAGLHDGNAQQLYADFLW